LNDGDSWHDVDDAELTSDDAAASKKSVRIEWSGWKDLQDRRVSKLDDGGMLWTVLFCSDDEDTRCFGYRSSLAADLRTW
jgi:hypothetical protein